MHETRFDSVAGAHEYVLLLIESVEQARREVAEDLLAARREGESRPVEALQLVAWKLERLEAHLDRSRLLLNDLRRLRRVLLGETEDVRGASRVRTGDDPWE